MRLFRTLLELVKWCLTIFITLIAFYFLSSNLNIFGSYRSFVVQSGSMEPAISTGDIIITKSQNVYNTGDIITFDNKGLVTHRIIAAEKESEEFHTKGDANRTNDEDKIAPEQIVGKVIMTIPRLGYLMSFAKTFNGLMLLVLIPASLYIIDELLNIIKNAKQKP